MNSKGFETISISVRTETKELFLQLFDQAGLANKSEFFKQVLDKYIKSMEPEPKNNDPSTEIILSQVEEGKIKLVISLNEVQNFALSYPFENFDDFIDLANEELSKMISKKDFFTGEIKFPDFFIEYDKEKDPDFNKGAFLVNVFMSCVAKKLISDVIPLKEVQDKAFEISEISKV